MTVLVPLTGGHITMYLNGWLVKRTIARNIVITNMNYLEH
jgi:hypothetical protein